MGTRSSATLKALALPVAFILLWHIASQQGAVWAYAFVPWGDVWASLFELIESGDLLIHISASVGTAMSGLLFGSIAGFLLGTVMVLFRPVDALLGPLFHALRQVPTIGLVPLIALWFGMGEFSIKLLVSLAVFEVIALNTYEGLRNVEARFLELGDALVFTLPQRFTRILLPAAFPSILTGLLQAVAFSWMATIGAELLFTTGPGLGAVMERAQLQARMDIVIVCLIFIGIFGFAMNSACVKLGQRILRWRQAG
jgi:sulfonate transport system permease protein